MKTDQSNPTLQQQAVSPHFYSNMSAVAWIVLAWIAGTLVFEVSASGAESAESLSLMKQWQNNETDFAITHAGIDQFDRVQRESQLRPVFQAVIAMADAKQSVKPTVKMPEVTEIASFVAQKNEVKNPIEASSEDVSSIIKQVVHSFQEWMTPVHVAKTESTRNRTKPDTKADVKTVTTPTVRENPDMESVTVADAEIIRVAAKPVVVPDTAHLKSADGQEAAVLDSEPIAVVAPLTTVATSNGSVASAAEEANAENAENARAHQVHKVAAKWPVSGNLLGGGFLGASNESKNQGVSLNVDEADVRGVLEMLARGYHMNILVAPDVVGTVTANVSGLSPEAALDGIVKMCGLNLQREGDLIYVYPATKLPADARQLRVFHLDFARADSLEPTVQGLLSPVGSAFTTKLDTADNMRTQETIVVVDIPDAIIQVEHFIMQADLAPRQVMIEANILEVQLEDDMMHGVNFESILGGDISVGSFGLADSIATKTNPLFFAQIEGSRVKSLIDLLETTTDSKTLASPRVQVINGQNARIQVGQQLGYTVATVTQTSTIQDVQFLDTGVVLSVTPTISRDNRILMIVKPEVSDGKINPDTDVPEKTTREVETSVLLDDHQGVIIGGLIQEKDETIVRKLPWLGDVKHIGKLFQRREALRSRTEIIVAMTCHIVEPCVQQDHECINLQRASETLFHGPLQRNCRPWEPRLPDSVGAEKHMDVNQLNRRIP